MIQSTPSIPRIDRTDNRPTVCHVIHALGVGGAEVLVDQMLRLLNDEFRCVVAVLDEIGEIGERLQCDGFTIEHLHRNPGIDHGCARRLKDFADREGAEILHAHQYTPFFQAMLSRGLFGRRPVVFTEHGRHFPDLPGRKRSIVNRLMLRNGDRLIGCGNAVRQALIANEGLPESRVEVIYNGVDLDTHGQASLGARATIRSEFGYAEDDFVVILVARLHPLKDHQTALRAIDMARRRISGLRLLLVGDGDQRTAIEQTIRELKLEETVTLAGTRTDVTDLLSAADAFLMSSISEGIPLTVIEAMAARIPVVATAVGGLPELIEHGVSGFLAPSGRSDLLAAAVVDLQRDADLRERIASVAAQRAAESFSLKGMLDAYRNVYRETLNSRQHRRRSGRSHPQRTGPGTKIGGGA
jgi:glycosyltransferase involved in cell wall biosynthesis